MAATHFGHCQICDREHKVTGTAIAKHGYTIRHGWQEGACYGSNGKPFELSSDLIEGAIVAAKRYIDQTNEAIARLRADPFGEYEKSKPLIYARVADKPYAASSDYFVRLITLTLEGGKIVARVMGDRIAYLYDKLRGEKTVEEAARYLADKRIAYLAGSVRDAESSVTFLQKRLASWKPGKLTPITAEEKAKAVPKIHFEAAKWGYKHTTACSHSAMAAQRNTSRRTTTDESKVTCTACVKEIAAAKERAAKKAAGAA